MTIGQRIEIPAHYDLWMRGARYGLIVAIRYKAAPAGRRALVKMDCPQVKKLVPVLESDWDYCNII